MLVFIRAKAQVQEVIFVKTEVKGVILLVSFAIKFHRSSMMTATEPRMCEGALKEKVLR